MKGETAMRKYAHNYKPTQDEINAAWEILSKVSMPEVTFHIYRECGSFNDVNSKVDRIASLIRSMGSFNEKDGNKVGFDFKTFFNSLPRVYYGEGNPNNGNPLFDEVILHGDDYILLQARGFEKNMSQYNWDAVRTLVEETGKRWKADVAELLVEKPEGSAYDLVTYTIKFWWD